MKYLGQEIPCENARSLISSQTEMDRLDFNHMLIMKAIGGKHFLAPVPQEETQRILDIGTGTGICTQSTIL